jgi:hypothetical protein
LKVLFNDSKVYDEIENVTGYARQSIKNYKVISEKIESSLRRDDVPFAHHKEIAKLEPVEQEKYLEKCKLENLSVKEIRKCVRK